MTVICSVYVLLLNLIALTYTTQMESLNEIPNLKKSSVIIQDDQKLLDKINSFLRDGRDHLQIVTDFDQTLTGDPGENGKTVLNSYEMLRKLPSIPKIYKDEDTKLFLKYKPIEDDPNLSIEEKSKSMVEWYRASQNLLRGLKFPRQELADLAQNVSNSFRQGVDTLIKWSEVNDVPILVLSSGLGEAVVATLKAANLLARNIKVVSNFLQVNQDDIITGQLGNPIHSYNKNEASLKETDYYNTIKERNNVILLGDNIGDANMTEGLDNCNTVIKIAFLSKKKENELQKYVKVFDIVLKNDQTMDVVNAIINVI